MARNHSILDDQAGRTWLASRFVQPAFAGEDGGESGGEGGDAGASDNGGDGGDAGTDDAGEKPAASGKKGSDAGGDPAGAVLRKEAATLRKKIAARTEELERVRKRNSEIVDAIGGEERLEEFRTWEKDRQEKEEELLRSKGDFEKFEAKLRQENSTLKSEIESLKLGGVRKDIERELRDAATDPEIDAVNPSQIVRLYADEMTLDVDENSETYGHYVHKTEYNEDGNKMSARELLMQERSGAGANLFKSTLKPGSGAGDGDSVESGAVTVKMVGGALSPEEQAKHDKAVQDGRPINFVHTQAA